MTGHTIINKILHNFILNLYSFGLNDIIQPEPKRLRYFLSHFINFWLFCNAHYNQFSEVNDEVMVKANHVSQLEENIKKFQKHNEELKMSKASSAMKSQKLKDKIAQDKQKVTKLSEDVNAFAHQTQLVKEELHSAKQKEAELLKQNDELEKTELRLKTMSKADETKQELEDKLNSLKHEDSEKMIQIQNYRLKEKDFDSEESLWKEILSNCKILLNISGSVKTNLDDRKNLMIQCETSHENLESIEKQLVDVQKIIHLLKNDIALAKTKWDKNKTLRETDLLEYNAQLKSLSLATTEDDIMTGELDTR